MFKGCVKLPDFKEYTTGKKYARPFTTENIGYFNSTFIELEAYAVLRENEADGDNNYLLEFKYGVKNTENDKTFDVEDTGVEIPGWHEYCDDISSVKFDSSFKYAKPKSMYA